MSLNNPKIIDLSHWNAPSDLNKPAIQEWDKAKALGVVGAIIRLGSIDDVSGIPYTDYRLDEFVRGGTNAKVPLGYYWYTRPKWGGGKQVDYILKIMQEKNLPFNLDFMIDVEEPGQYPDQARDAVKYMAKRLSEIYPGRVGIYTRQNLWDAYVSQDTYWSTLKLWAARWSTLLTSPWSDGYNKFRDWTIWKYWQYSANGNLLGATYGFPSGTVNIDLSYYYGTEEAFLNEYNLKPTDAVEELAKRLTNLEVLHTETLTKLALINNQIIGLDGQISLLEEKQLSLENWAKGINYK